MSLKYQFQLIQAMRNYFNNQGFLDVLTPPMVENPGMETHIHPFEVFSKLKNKSTDLYLHTSPEFMMKELLSKDEFEKIFTISYCFRDEPTSPIHRPQFLMCEWYRKNERYEAIMTDVEQMILSIQNELIKNSVPLKENFVKDDFQKVTVQDLFQDILKIDILDYLDTKDLRKKIELDFKGVPLPSSQCTWDDYFFLLFLNEVEPFLINYKALLLYEYPHHLAALSTLKASDPRVCERFELYIRGVEICNCFNELTDYDIQSLRFKLQAADKKSFYNYQLPDPNRFMATIKSGYPKSSGIALGIERLLNSLVKTDTLFFD